MKTLKVADMHCEMCVSRIKKALSEAGIAHSVSLAEKTVEVEDAAVKDAIAALEDLGFSAKE